MFHSTRLLIPIIVLLLLVTVSAPAHAQSGDPVRLYDIPYLTLDDGDLLLDVYLPGDASGPYPVVLMLHGYHGSKGEIRGYVADLTGQGWAVVAPNYRFSAEGFPYDAFCARAWITAQADQYDLNAALIAVYGTALGGQIAALMGAVDMPDVFVSDDCPYPAPPVPLVAAVVTWGGFFGTEESLAWSGQRARWAVLAGQSPRDYNARLDELSAVSPLLWRTEGVLSDEARAVAQSFPLYWIDGTEPPYLLLHGRSSYNASRTEHHIFAGLLALGGMDDVTLVDLSPFTEHSGALAGQTAEIETFLSKILIEPLVADRCCGD